VACNSPSIPPPRNMPTTSSPSHPGRVLPTDPPWKPRPCDTAMLPREKGAKVGPIAGETNPWPV
jgi:hypothetical protein